MKNLQHYFKYSLIILFLHLGSQSLIGQENRVYATAGIYYSLSYEREVYATENESKSVFLRAHGGNIQQVWYSSDDTFKYRHVGLSTGILFGMKPSKFEVTAGVGHLWTFSERSSEFVLTDKDYLLNANIGYRYQSDDIVFRAGLGIPELIYLSFGFRF